jgi:hypothetical protein
VVKVRLPPIELEIPIDPSPDPKAEQERRFDLFLRYEGCGQLVSDDSEAGRQWRELALRLAALHHRGLQLPKSRPPRKRRGKPNVDEAIFEAVNRELEKADGKISMAKAFRRANKDGIWTERQFTLAKNRWHKANPSVERQRGRPKKARGA